MISIVQKTCTCLVALFLVTGTAEAQWTNGALAKTAAYTARSSDCGSTITLGGRAFYTLTFNAASGYASRCAFLIKNTDTVRAKTVAPGGVTPFVLYPVQSVFVSNSANAWQVTNPGRWRISNDIRIYVDNNGSDTANDCLASGASGACNTNRRNR